VNRVQKLHYKASHVYHKSCVAIPTSSSLAESVSESKCFR